MDPNHSVEDYPHKKAWNATPILLALSAPPVRRNLGPAEELHFLPSSELSTKPKKGTRAGAGREKGQVYNVTAEEAEASEEVVADKILIHSNPIFSTL